MTDASQEKFLSTANTDTIPSDLVEKFPTFHLEMNENLQLFRKAPSVYRSTSEDAFTIAKYMMWIIGLALNILLIIFYRRDTQDEWMVDSGNKAITIIAIVLAVSASILWLAWIFTRYMQKIHLALLENEADEVNMRFYKTLPIVKLIRIYWYKSLIREPYPAIFSLVIVSNVLGLVVHPVFYTFQLLTIVALSHTASYVVKAITTHFD